MGMGTGDISRNIDKTQRHHRSKEIDTNTRWKHSERNHVIDRRTEKLVAIERHLRIA